MSAATPLFQPWPTLPGDIDTGMRRTRVPTYDHTAHTLKQVADATERWVRKAIEKGPGWSVWRSNPRPKGDEIGDIFVIVYDFALIEPGAPAPGAGVLFRQPELTDGERVRLLAGRHDWRELAWEDECGVDGCGHSCCEAYRHGR